MEILTKTQEVQEEALQSAARFLNQPLGLAALSEEEQTIMEGMMDVAENDYTARQKAVLRHMKRSERQIEDIKFRWKKRRERNAKKKSDAIVSDYMKRINAQAATEAQEGTDGWFQAMLDQSVKMRNADRITHYADKCNTWLMAAYKKMVERNEGRVMEVDNFVKQALDAVARWMVSHTKQGLMLRGYVGVGKTTMLEAMSSVWYFCEKIPIKVVTADKIVAMAKDDPLAFKALFDVKLLGIDDLGTEPYTVKSYGNESTPMSDLITYREKNNKFTIITTNLIVRNDGGKDVDEIEERYGTRMYDRLKNLCDSIGYSSEQKSYRR